MQVIPWILDIGYTIMCVAIMLAVMGHILFGDFEITMTTIPDSISGEHSTLPGTGCCSAWILIEPNTLLKCKQPRQSQG